MLIIFFVILGLAIGSFINAFVHRMHEGMTLAGRSQCPRCRKQIAWFDNVPLLSFAFLRGRCRCCWQKISLQYPIIEGLTASVFGLIGFLYFVPGEEASMVTTLWLLGLAILLITISLYDFRYMEIPLFLVYAGVALTFLYLFWLGFGYPWQVMHPLVLGLLGGTAVAFFFFLLVYFSQETWMGWGDVWIGFLAGMIVGLPQAFFLLTLSFTIGAVVGIGAILAGAKHMKSALPFGPFLALGAILTIFLERTFPEILTFFFFA